MKKREIFTLTILTILLIRPMTLAYIDPGTGGYLVTTIWTQFAVYIGLAVTLISTYFIKPIKNFLIKHYKVILIILTMAILTSFFAFNLNPFRKSLGQNHNKTLFDESLSGIQIYNKDKAYEGYNLFEGKLIDMQGNIVKDWDYVYLGTLDKEGNYYAQEYYESLKWGKFTWNNELIWEKDIPIHHEILITPDDTIITFTKEAHEYNGRMVEFDIILEFDKDGNELTRWSTWDNLEEIKQFHKPLELERPKTFLIPETHKKNTSIWGANYDYYHLNAISILPENDLSKKYKAFQKGNWLISFRHGSMLFILDKDTKNIVWRAIDDQIEGSLQGQHSPFMRPNGNILIYENGRYRNKTRIIEIEPISLKIVWEYSPDDFFSLSQGYLQLLPNNNLLITESEKGRVFELNKDKEIVWEYYHPEVQNKTNSNYKESYGTRQWIYRMTRYPKEFIDNINKK